MWVYLLSIAEKGGWVKEQEVAGIDKECVVDIMVLPCLPSYFGLMKPHLVLIDGHHLMYRAYYAIPRTLKTSKGEQTNAVYGVASMLIAILKIEEPDALLFCFDKGEETFRHQENATYKDGRAETPLLDGYNAQQETGNAFLYDPPSMWNCFAAMVRALETYRFPFDWKTIQKHGLETAGKMK